VIRTIDGFHRDDQGDWVAELSCLHGQHVRHRPPFQERPWVVSAGGRAARLGSVLECPLCDRMELPAGLQTVRTDGPFDADTVPPSMRHREVVPHRTWALLRVVDGSVGLVAETTPTMRVRVLAGEAQAIPPDVPHGLTVDGPVQFAVDYLVKPAVTER